MRISTAKKILQNNGILWSNYFDLVFIEKARSYNWVGCEDIREAIKTIKTFLISGKTKA